MEVTSSTEALEIVLQGQQRSQRTFSSESKHQILIIHITQAPYDPLNKEVLQDRNLMVISQLTVVDLGITEGLYGKAFYNNSSPGNNSFAVLKRCLTSLKRTQEQNIFEIESYHPCKLTCLLKSVFKSKGKIRLIVSLNQGDDCEQAMHAMQFAEITKEVMNSSSSSLSTNNSLSEKSGEETYCQETVKLSKHQNVEKHNFMEIRLNYEFPTLYMDSIFDEGSYLKLLTFLNNRMTHRKECVQGVIKQQENARKKIIAVVRENEDMQKENKELQITLESKHEQVLILERKVNLTNDAVENLKKKCCYLKKETEKITCEIHSIDKKILQLEKVESSTKAKLESEKRLLRKIMERKFTKKEIKLERKICTAGKKLKQFEAVLNKKSHENTDIKTPVLVPYDVSIASFSSVQTAPSEIKSKISEKCVDSEIDFDKVESLYDFLRRNGSNVTLKDRLSEQSMYLSSPRGAQAKTSIMSQRSAAVANVRHHFSHMNAGGKWIVHKPMENLSLNTVLKPNLKKTRSVAMLKFGDLANSNTSKYALQHQVQNSCGEVEIFMYKADVIPTSCGGFQVIFNDVEILKQSAPPCVQ